VLSSCGLLFLCQLVFSCPLPEALYLDKMNVWHGVDERRMKDDGWVF
jgi:hypothetical protein